MKCDETQPQCIKCSQAKKECFGYAQTSQTPAPSSSEWSIVTNRVRSPFRDHIRLNTLPIPLEDSHLADLGLEVLFQGRHESTSWGLSTDWLQLLNHSFIRSDAVLKSLLFLGKTCEALFLPHTSQQHMPLILRHRSAIVSLQEEIETLPNGPLPVLLASVVLAVSSVLLQRLSTALMHANGAFRSFSLLLGNSEQYPGRTQIQTLDGSFQHLHSIVLSLDMHTSWYRLSRPPDLPRSIEISKEIPRVEAMSNIDVATLLHDCFHFASAASRYKYFPHYEVPSGIVREQNYFIAVLNRIVNNTNSPQSRERHHLGVSMTQTVQCLGVLVHLSTILQPYECAYDQFEAYFFQIVNTSEDLMSKGNQNKGRSCLPRFQLQPGLFQPLWFTAIKCRASAIRRRAFYLLGELGCEGPWNSRIMTAVVRRLISIEEKDFCPTLDLQHDRLVLEPDRIHGCGINNVPFDDCTFPVCVTIELSRCSDVQEMILVPKTEQERYWEIWNEVVDVTGYI